MQSLPGTGKLEQVHRKVIEISFVDTLSNIDQTAKKIYFGPQSAMTFFGRQVLADRPLVHPQGLRQLNYNKTWTDILGN